ncbi:hypothetical protein C7S17_2744 [Burkholderia thailandensis]|nr:hypothetical protein [Burkholderia thailandensis]
MPLPHLVQQAVGVRVKGRWHKLVPRRGRCAPRVSVKDVRDIVWCEVRR